MAKYDILGQTFGRLTALRRRGDGRPDRYYVTFRCACGVEKEMNLYLVLSGNTQSCGCLKVETAGKCHVTHGGHSDPAYGIWKKLRARCLNKNDSAYKHYGGRGITVDPSWNDFATFLRDVGPRPDGLWIERMDNSKGYGPGNCVWATATEQGRNKRNNVNLTHEGETLCMSAWAERMRMPYKRLTQRLRYGWSVERALTEPVRG